MKYLRILVFILAVFISKPLCFGQSEEGWNDCTVSKEIIIPFNSSSTTNNKPSLKQTVFYSYRDQFSFWYKIVVKENSSVSFKVTALNDSDSYIVYVYQYNEKDFCNKLYGRKITPVKPSFFTNKTSKESSYDLSQKTFNAQKNNIYYISVLNTSLNNCGHNFNLINGTDTLKVKAIHIPCKRDVSTLTAKPVTINNPLKKQDTLAAKTIVPENSPKKTQLDTSSGKSNLLFCILKDSKKKSFLKIKPVITDLSSGDELQVTLTENGEWSCNVEKGKSYKVLCASVGYKNTVQTLQINKAITTLDIFLDPLKEGDIFIMKSIYFYPNTYALKKESAGELQKLLNFLLENNNISIEIQGHTNGDHRVAKNKAYASLGEEWNFQGSAKELSQKRAEAIKLYLENNGVKQERLLPKGYGGKKPIVKDPQDNEEGQMNIRVEIVILKT